MRRQSPNADRARSAPGPSSVGRFRLQGFAPVLGIVIAYVHDDAAIGSLHGVQFVILHRCIAGADGNVGKPTPTLAIVGRFADPDLLAGLPELLPGIEQPAVSQGRWTVRAIHRNAVRRRPGHASIGGAQHPGVEQGVALFGGGAQVRGLPALEFCCGPTGRLL